MIPPKSEHRSQRDGEESVRTVIRPRQRRTPAAAGVLRVAIHVPRPVPGRHREEEKEEHPASTPRTIHRSAGPHQAELHKWRATGIRRSQNNLAVREWGLWGCECLSRRGEYIDAAECGKGRRVAACAARA